MAGKKQEPINTIATVTIGGVEYDMDCLSKEQKRAVSDQLNLQMCNAIYDRTKYKFYINRGYATVNTLFNLPCKKETN